MEFQGRIAKVLPMRSGTSTRTGNEWKSLPFIFEYFEHDSDRYADSVLLETFDEKIIPQIVENVSVRIGFGHHVREYTSKDGKPMTINEIRMYKFESLAQGANQGAQGANGQQVGQQQAPFPPQVDQNGNPINQGGGNADDLPF